MVPTRRTLFQLTVFFAFILFCVVADVSAQSPGAYNDQRMAEAVAIIMGFLQGSFGALIMTVAGLMAIFNAAMGNYKASTSLLVIAVGTFILKSFIATFFNTESIPGF